MDIPSLLAAYLISQGAHTGGHFAEAQRQNVPISLDTRNLAEDWTVPFPKDLASKPDPRYAALYESAPDQMKDYRRKESMMNGAGFVQQDQARDMFSGDTKSNVATMNAILKALYLSGAADKFSNVGYKKGDIGGMEKASGNQNTKALLAASILGDIYAAQNPNSNWSYNFDVIDGSPGGRINFRW